MSWKTFNASKPATCHHPSRNSLSITCKQTRYPAPRHTAKSKMKIAPKWCPHRNIANQTDSKVSTNQILQPISSLPCRRVIQHPKSYPNIQLQITRPQIAEKSRFFCKFDVHSPGGLRPEIVRQQWKILYFSSPNFCLFQSQITFRYILI